MTATTGGWPAFAALTVRELVRFSRQPSRIVAVLGTPLLLWLFFGSGFAHSVAGGRTGVSYAAFLLPGMISLTVMFSSIFAAISLIEDRHEGFLQSVLVSPAPRWAAVGAKIAGGTIIAAAQGILLLGLAPVLGLHPGVGGYALAVTALVLIAVLINGIGLAAAWWIDSTQGFHGVMNLVLMPMWLLSGSLFPAAGASAWLRAIITINPLYWTTAALRSTMVMGQGDDPAGSASGEPFSAPLVWFIAAGTAALGFALAWVVVGRTRFGGKGAQ